MLGSIGTLELMIIVLVLLLVFGGQQLPHIIRSMTRTWKEVQKTTQQVRDEIEDAIKEDETDKTDRPG
jgi:Tat protein translocase TatB subunit